MSEERYSKVGRRLWADAGFLELSAPKPCAQVLWFRLLTGPELTNVPGLYAAYDVQLAAALGWPVKAFRKAFDEIAVRGMAKADWKKGLIWVPNAIKHNEPQSVNVVKSWLRTLPELPECALKDEAIARLREHLSSMGPGFLNAFDESKRKPSSNPYPMPTPEASAMPRAIQEQKQEQEQKQIPPTPQGASSSNPDPESETRPAKLNAANPWELEAAQRLPLRERTRHLLENLHATEWLAPQDWPEVRRVVAVYAEAAQRAVPDLGRYERDSVVKQAVALFEVFSCDDVCRAIPVAVSSDYWKSKPNRRFTSLTIETVRTALDQLANSGPRVDSDATKRREEAQQRKLERERDESLRKAGVNLDGPTLGPSDFAKSLQGIGN